MNLQQETPVTASADPPHSLPVGRRGEWPPRQRALRPLERRPTASRRLVREVTVAAAALLLGSPLLAQARPVVDLTVNDVGIAIGDAPRVTGLRINFRDRHLERVIGANLTVWLPHEYSGDVTGLAVGLPLTGARRIEGVGAGILGVAVESDIRGVAVGGLGVGAGNSIRGASLGTIGVGAGNEITGLQIGGVGLGAGNHMRGISLAGLGIGAGNELSGLQIAGGGIGAGNSLHGISLGGLAVAAGNQAEGLQLAGLGVGAGNTLRGVSVAGLGIAAGNDAAGLQVAGLGIGAGNSLRGLTLAGLGVAAGDDATGVQLAGVGIGAGGTLRWLSVAGIGIGASRIEGLAIAAAIGTSELRGATVAPAYFRLEGGVARGVTLSAFNDVRGVQQGLAIGIVNYARELDGLQIGLINYARNKPAGTRVLPLANYARVRR